jgi:hypothetical protein
MPSMKAERPIRGVPGGGRDIGEDDDRAVIAAEREREAQFKATTARVAAAWRAELATQPSTAKRRGSARPATGNRGE